MSWCSRIAACPASQVLGKLGQGFAPMQLRLTVRRIQMGAWCIGITRRALDMMMDHAKQRATFGVKLADRQAIQWWIADAAMKLHACRLMVLDAAAKQDAGQDVRTEASMVKVFGTEMAQRGAGPRDADLRRDGRCQGAAVAVDDAEGAHHARL